MAHSDIVEPRAFYGRPFAWLLFALLLLVIPAIGFMLTSDLAWEQVHPAINAMLNGSSAVFLAAGFLAIKRRKIEFHKRCMLAAFTASSLFLISYIARFYISGTHKYPGHGWDRTLYLIILFSHMLLALALLPMVLRTLYLGLKNRRAKHRKIARWAWPIWMYVSVTGVIVYLMLYQLAGALHGHP